MSKLGHFKVPLIQIFLWGVIKDIVKVCSLFPQYNLARYEGWSKGDMYILFLLPQARSKDSFKKISRERLTKLPWRPVRVNNFHRLPEREKEAQMKYSEKDIRVWMIAVLTDNEDGMDIIKEIAREKLGIVETMVMPENIIVSLFKLKNMLLTDLPTIYFDTRSYRPPHTQKELISRYVKHSPHICWRSWSSCFQIIP